MGSRLIVASTGGTSRACVAALEPDGVVADVPAGGAAIMAALISCSPSAAGGEGARDIDTGQFSG